MFWAKKFISFWLLPLPLCLTLLSTGILLRCLTRRVRLARLFCGAGTILLLFFSNKPVSRWLVRPLEALYPAIPELEVDDAALPGELARCRHVVVLGGGHSDTPGLPPNSQLSGSALARIVEGVRLLQALPGATLIVSGPAVGGHPSHARVLARAAESMGIAPGRLTLVENARDTEDEALAVHRLVGDTPVALVTSAWHMPRAAALFRKAGVTVLPCPADFSGRRNEDFRWGDLTWDTASLERSTWAVQERIGYLWVRLRGKV